MVDEAAWPEFSVYVSLPHDLDVVQLVGALDLKLISKRLDCSQHGLVEIPVRSSANPFSAAVAGLGQSAGRFNSKGSPLTILTCASAERNSLATNGEVQGYRCCTSGSTSVLTSM